MRRDRRPINYANPVNAGYPQNAWKTLWCLALPGFVGGAKWRDLTSQPDLRYGRHGTLNNIAQGASSGWAPTNRPGGFSEFRVDGVDDYIQFPALVPALPFSIGISLKYTTSSNTVVFEENGNSGFSIQTSPTGVAGGLSCWTGGTNNGVKTNAAWNDGAWHRFYFSLVFGAGVCYVDGVAASSLGSVGGCNTPSYAAAPIYLGSRAGSFGYNSAADDVTIYSRAGNAGDALADYEENRRGHPNALNRVGTMTYSIPSVLGLPKFAYYNRRRRSA